MTAMLPDQDSRVKQTLRKTSIAVATIALFIGTTALMLFIKNTCDIVKFRRTYDRLSFNSACISLFNISVRNAGCLRYGKRTFINASSNCYFTDMQLLEIDSEEEKAIVIVEALKFFRLDHTKTPKIWINARWSKYEKQYITHPRGMKLAFKLDQSMQANESDCLAIESSSTSESFNFTSVPCDDSNFFFCEF
jgi:hypothetical protein